MEASLFHWVLFSTSGLLIKETLCPWNSKSSKKLVMSSTWSNSMQMTDCCCRKKGMGLLRLADREAEELFIPGECPPPSSILVSFFIPIHCSNHKKRLPVEIIEIKEEDLQVCYQTRMGALFDKRARTNSSDTSCLAGVHAH